MRVAWLLTVAAALQAILLVALPRTAYANELCDPFAGGGEVSLITDGNEQYCVHRFLTTGATSFVAQQSLSVEYLVVGGGGGGGSSDLFNEINFMSGGGGGAGGVRQATDIPILSGTHTVVVGTGGTGGTQNRGANGGNSTFGDITAIGGGGGGGSTVDPVSVPPTSGGSGGGGGGRQSWNDAPATNGADGTTAQGNSGGDGGNGPTGGTRGANAPEQAGGGGGGAGGPGGNGLTNQGGTGGAGITSFITGLAQGYGGGGGGGHRGDTGSGGSATHGGGTGAGGTSTAAAGNGTANTGGGGGGAGRGLDQGGNGGSGVVVIRYLVNTAPKADAGAPQSVTAFTAVSLDGSASVDVDDNIISYNWTQSSGTSVALLDGDTATPGFTAPQPTGSSETLVFQLTVTDGFGLTSTDEVTVTVAALPGQPQPASGGTVNEFNDVDGHVTWRTHSFFSNDTLTLPDAFDVEYLIVGGGGGGGAAAGGGGGGGGMRTGTATGISGEQPITVGTGGAGGIGSFPDSPQQSRGANGGNSAAFGVLALGGGGGGTYFSNTSSDAWAGLDGGSGGGGSHTSAGGAAGDNDQGNSGATGSLGCGMSSGGGGGGAAQAGSVGTSSQGGKGGDGAVSGITGVLQFSAGGGAGGGDDRTTSCSYTGVAGVIPNDGGLGGGGASTATHGQPGVNGLGGGGGGAQLNTAVYTGGAGGSGIVVARYVINTGPTANAGANANAFAGLEFTLDGTGSSDPDGPTSSGNITSYSWTQLAGTPVLPALSDSAQISFTPAQPAADAPSEILVFELTVTDAFGLTSVDTVTITLQGVAELTATKRVAVFSENGNDCADLNATAPPEPMTPAAIPGACIEYEIDVENTGPVAAQGISLVDELPASLRYQNAQLGGDWGAGTALTTPNCPEPGCEIRVDDGVLAAGATATITIRATIN